MTFRAKPVARRDDRPPRHSGDRRSFLINLGFVITIVSAVVILAAAVVLTWYDQHLAPAAKVGTTTITKDQLAARYEVETFRLDYTEARLRTLVNLGYITPDQEAQQISILGNTRGQLTSIVLERLIDAQIQAGLADGMGITVTDADIDARQLTEATIDEQRHAWVIEVAAEKDPWAREPTEAQKAEAREKAAKALADLKSGTPWEDVVISVSTAEFGGEAGDIGFIGEQVAYDKAYLAAIFDLPVDGLTDVIEGSDGIYRIGRITAIGPGQVDDAFQSRLEAASIDIPEYRAALRADVIRDRLEEKVIADLSQPSEQRQIQEIYLEESGLVSTDAVKVRHILYSPDDDPAGAASLAEDDPAWAAAEQAARAAYAKLSADISQFDQIARTESDETSAPLTGGKLPYYDASSSIDEAFAAAILNPDRKPGELLQPVRSAYGWHVIQIMHGPTDGAWASHLKELLDGGANFADLARDNSDGPGAAEGGDAGWVSRGELGQQLGDAVFGTTVGSVSNPVVVGGDGIYLFKILAEEVRDPTPAQISTYESVGFSNWYGPRKAAVTVERLLVRSF